MWISGGDHELAENIVHMVLAKLPESPPGVKGISLFVVPRIRVDSEGRPGEWNNISLAGLNHKMGQRATTNCLLNFGEQGASLGYLVGEPNLGLTYMFHMMNEARIGVGMSSAMSALAGYLFSLEYSRTRRQGRPLRNKDPRSPQVPIIEHADVKRMLLSQKAAVEGALALSTHCMMLVDRKLISTDPAERADLDLLLELLTPIAKSWPSEHCLEANKWAIQVLGGYGYSRDYPVERFYRDNRLNHIHEGTFAIQALDLLGRKVRLSKGRALELLLAGIRQTIEDARRLEMLSSEVQQLEQAVQALDRATCKVKACEDPDLALANATLYLDSCGQVVVAWLWLKQAVIASNALEGAPAAYDVDFYRGKISACRYFFRYELSRSIPWFDLVASLDDTCLRMGEAEFVGS
jgi:Acetyl-CoA dehydrogenase C-terminal like/Acyl-CoA dehydrogenase, C-terminal domain